MISEVTDNFLGFLFPELKISGTKWFSLWKLQRNKKFVNNAIIALIACAVVHLAHMFWIDPGFSLDWKNYRISMALISLAAGTLTYRLRHSSEYILKLPFVIAALFVSVYLAKTCVWYNRIPYLECYLIAFICGIVLQLGPALFLLWLLGVFLLQIQFLLQAGHDFQMLISVEVIAFGVGLTIQSRITSEIDLFLLEHREAETQKKLIETELELSNQMKAFLPAEIHRRLLHAVHVKNLSVAEAVKQAIAQRQAKVACLMSDIRSYTKQTNNNENYVHDSAVPNIKICTEIIDSLGGVSRHIGDMIFAYFEEEDPREALKKAVLASCKLVEESEQLNNHLKQENRILRYPLISFGDGLVGNIGAENSSREITVLGVPANILSRVDELTKNASFKNSFKPGTIILTAEASNFINKFGLLDGVKLLKLETLDLKIRDFPNETQLGYIEDISQVLIRLRSDQSERKAA